MTGLLMRLVPVALAAFAAGWWLGRAELLAVRAAGAGAATVPAAISDVAVAVPGRTPDDPMTVASRVAGVALQRDEDGEPARSLARYERLQRSRSTAAALRVRDDLISRIRALAAVGAVADALDLLAALSAIDPYDAEFLLIESDLRQRQGRLLEAIEPLLALLRQSNDDSLRARAREQLRLLVDVHEIQLANRRDYPGLVRFFEELVLGDPGWDEHRLRLARWLLQQGRVDEAAAIARELGGAGVSDAAREDLLAAIALAQDGLPVERSGRSLHVRAQIAGRPVRLLVDTGATHTVLSAGLARAIGSRVRGEPVEVRTAAGSVPAEVHEVADLRIGELRIPALEVLVLERVPDGADGLLGMDVLERLPQEKLPFSWLGRPPASE